MAVPSVRAVGPGSSGTASITANLPTGWQENDILIIVAETANQAFPNDPTSAGYTLVSGLPAATGTAGSGHAGWVWWKRATASESNFVLGDAGNHGIARMIAVQDVITSGDPWDTNTSNSSGNSATWGWGAFNTTVNDTLVVLAAFSDADVSTAQLGTVTAANLSSVTEHFDVSTTGGAGGGIALATGVLATAGSIGTPTATKSTSGIWKTWAGALKPATSTTYQQQCYATGSGAVSFADALVLGLAASTTGTGTASLSRLMTYSRLFSAAGTGTVSLSRMISKTLAASGTGAPSVLRNISKTFTTTGTGTVSATATLVTSIIQQCYAAGSAAVTLAKRVTKVLSASATGSPALVKAVSKTFSATGTGAASLTKNIGKVLTATGAGAVALTKRISKVFATTGTGSVSYSDALVTVRQLIANAVGTVTASQTFIVAPPVQAWFAKVRRSLFRYIRRR